MPAHTIATIIETILILLDKPNYVYNLTQDVESDGTCFYVKANNVTLDCKGFEINYSQSVVGYGVNVTGYNNTIIKSCDIVQGSTLGSSGDGSYGVYIYRNSSNNIALNNVL